MSPSRFPRPRRTRERLRLLLLRLQRLLRPRRDRRGISWEPQNLVSLRSQCPIEKAK